MMITFLVKKKGSLGNSPRSYKEILLGLSMANEDLDIEGEDDLENMSKAKVREEDFNGFNIIKELDGEKSCPVFLISQKEEKMSRP